MQVGSGNHELVTSPSWLASSRLKLVVPAAIFVLAAILRCLVWWTGTALTTSDYDDYREHGAELFASGVISDPHIMPGYALLTQLFGEDTGVILLDIGLSSLTCVLVWWLAGRLFEDRLAAALSGIGAALHPNLILTAASGLTEPSFTFLFLGALVLFYRENYVAGSLLFVLSILIRPSFDLLAPVLIFVFVVATHGQDWKQGLRKVGIYTVCYVVLMAPWWVHNLNKYNGFVRLNLADGYVLYAGNNPNTKTGEGTAADLSASDPLLAITDPLEQNAALKRAALRFIVEQPARFFTLSGKRFIRFWHIESSSNLTVYLFVHPFTLIFAGFLVFGSLHRWRETLPLVLCIVYLASVHTALISLPRYQLPVAPIVILLGVAWLTVTLRAFVLRKRGRP